MEDNTNAPIDQNEIGRKLALTENKNLYKPGDITTSGSKIFRIFGSTVNHVVFFDEDYSIGWEIAAVPKFTQKALSKCSDLITIANAELSPDRLIDANQMLAAAVHSALSSNEELDLTILFERAENYINKHKDEIVKRMGFGPGFLIYKAKDGEVRWIHKCLTDVLKTAVEEFTSLSLLANAALPSVPRAIAQDMLGSSLTIAFHKNKAEDLTNVFSGPKEFIISQVTAYYKIKYFLIGAAATIICLLLLMLLTFKLNLNATFSLGAGAGVLGAFVSSLQRNNTISINPYGSRLGIYTEVLSRLAIGIIFGLLLVFILKSEIALSAFRDNFYALICFAFLAGFSERFVPDLLSTVSKNSDK